MSWKYIMVQVDETAIPIIFPDRLVHKDIWQRTAKLFYDQSKMKDPEVVGAGFIHCLSILDCSGESETLDIKARPQDRQLINNFPYESGVTQALSNRTEILILTRTVELMLDRINKLTSAS
jgi:hypothetical protein